MQLNRCIAIYISRRGGSKPCCWSENNDSFLSTSTSATHSPGSTFTANPKQEGSEPYCLVFMCLPQVIYRHGNIKPAIACFSEFLHFTDMTVKVTSLQSTSLFGTQDSANLALWLENKPALQLSNESLLTTINSRARQQEPTGLFTHAGCGRGTAGPYSVSLLTVNK